MSTVVVHRWCRVVVEQHYGTERSVVAILGIEYTAGGCRCRPSEKCSRSFSSATCAPVRCYPTDLGLACITS
jgi:hypothetical protein